jgi:hypothetical protein
METYSDDEEAALKESLERRYGEPLAQHILEEIEKAKRGEIALPTDYMAIKELSELTERFRAQAQFLIWQLKRWRRAEDARLQTTTYIALEGEFLARQLKDALHLYRAVHHHYHASYRAAMDDIYARYHSDAA